VGFVLRIHLLLKAFAVYIVQNEAPAIRKHATEHFDPPHLENNFRPSLT
jgi:hypothetical protein